MKSIKTQKGLSLIEVLVAISIFAILGVVVTNSLVLTLQGTRKSESQIRVRENLNYAITVIERNLRNANKITDCPFTAASAINYKDQYEADAHFACFNLGSPLGHIASGPANVNLRLTPEAVTVTSCSFKCEYPAGVTKPAMITVDLTAKDASASGKIGATVTTQSIIYLRN